MSKALNLVCYSCRERQWIGQGQHIYGGDEYLGALEQFLFKHQQKPGNKHNLGFVDDDGDYIEISQFKEFMNLE